MRSRKVRTVGLLLGLVLLAGLAAASALSDLRITFRGGDPGERDLSERSFGEPVRAVLPAGVLRVVCERAGPPLEPLGSITIPEPVDRLLPAAGEILAVMDSGLWRWRGRWRDRSERPNGAVWERVLEGGRDYVLHADTILRLSGDSVEFFHHRPGSGKPSRVRWIPAGGGDSSIAVRGDELLLHSATYRNNHLLARRALRDGRILGYALRVERDYVRLFMNDFDALLRATSRVRAAGSRGVLVPLLENPIRLLDLDGSALMIYTWAVTPGRVRTVAREVVRKAPSCATCRREIKETTAHRFERVHADAAFAEGSLWVLGSVAAGSAEAVVYRIPLDSSIGSGRHAEGVRLARFRTPPRAIALSGDTLLAASEDRLYWFTKPQPDPNRKPKGVHCGETDSARADPRGVAVGLSADRRRGPGRP
ncbi:MAG TPA: hypothetical protein VM737_09210 [Gemmatimonadota bacterium]|nr:hypothetical protein [Gemmatimonadota bacterium]